MEESFCMKLQKGIYKHNYQYVSLSSSCVYRKKAKETIDEENHRIYLENRMKSLLSLKNNIEMSRVSYISIKPSVYYPFIHLSISKLLYIYLSIQLYNYNHLSIYLECLTGSTIA